MQPSSCSFIWTSEWTSFVEHNLNSRQCLVLSEQPFRCSLSAPYSTKIDFTKLLEQPSLDSSCGCLAVGPVSALRSQWDFSLPALVLQLTSPPTLGLFHLPLDLQKLLPGGVAAPRPSFGCSCGPELHTAAAPLFWGGQSCVCSCVQDRASMSAAVILCWSLLSQSHLPVPLPISIFSLTASLRTQPLRLVFSQSCRLFSICSFHYLLLLGPSWGLQSL